MKTGPILACAFALSCLLAPAAGVAHGQPALPGDDAGSLARMVRESPQLTIFDDVDVRREGDALVLTGSVTAEPKRAEIARRVAAVQGTHQLRNEIVVLPAGPEDDNLRHRVARAIYGDPSFWSYAAMTRPPIHIIVERGHVTLRGTVATAAQRTMARSLAAGSGERSLINELRTLGR